MPNFAKFLHKAFATDIEDLSCIASIKTNLVAASTITKIYENSSSFLGIGPIKSIAILSHTPLTKIGLIGLKVGIELLTLFTSLNKFVAIFLHFWEFYVFLSELIISFHVPSIF